MRTLALMSFVTTVGLTAVYATVLIMSRGLSGDAALPIELNSLIVAVLLAAILLTGVWSLGEWRLARMLGRIDRLQASQDSRWERARTALVSLGARVAVTGEIPTPPVVAPRGIDPEAIDITRRISRRIVRGD